MESCWLIEFEDGHRIIVPKTCISLSVSVIGLAEKGFAKNIGLALKNVAKEIVA